MITNAIPQSGGICWKNCCNAFSPPADAPMPTIHGPLSGLASSNGSACVSCSRESDSLTCASICCRPQRLIMLTPAQQCLYHQSNHLAVRLNVLLTGLTQSASEREV